MFQLTCWCLNNRKTQEKYREVLASRGASNADMKLLVCLSVSQSVPAAWPAWSPRLQTSGCPVLSQSCANAGMNMSRHRGAGNCLFQYLYSYLTTMDD